MSPTDFGRRNPNSIPTCSPNDGHRCSQRNDEPSAIQLGDQFDLHIPTARKEVGKLREGALALRIPGVCSVKQARSLSILVRIAPVTEIKLGWRRERGRERR